MGLVLLKIVDELGEELLVEDLTAKEAQMLEREIERLQTRLVEM